MLHQISEKSMHHVRLLLAIGWLLLIVSLFYDPFTPALTNPDAVLSVSLFRQSEHCIFFQGQCLSPKPYRLGTRIFWAMIVPSSIVILLVLGHEAWRRICPLAFVSQLASAVGLQRKRRMGDSQKTTRYEPIKISKESWLARHALIVQFCLLFVGLTIRLLFTNSDPILLGTYLILILLAAITVGYLYGGKTWCHYFCPMAPVQVVFTGPRGLLGSRTHLNQPGSITQSMCRTVDKTGTEKSACVGCKQLCFDIDAEQAHWNGIHQFDRKLVYYGYVGLVLGFFLYFPLYSGNWNLLANGVWTETNQLETLLKSGVYWFNQTLPVPKLVAVPLTLGCFAAMTYGLGTLLENLYKQCGRQFNSYQNLDHAQSQVFAACTFLSFSLFIALGMQPSMGWIHSTVQERIIYPVLDSMAALWCVRTMRRNPNKYIRERLSTNLRRQLKRLNIDFSNVFDGRSLEDLNADEVYSIAKTHESLTHEKHLQIYKNCLQDVLADASRSSLDIEVLKTMRKHLDIDDEEHQLILSQLGIDSLSLIATKGNSVSEGDERHAIAIR
jgi:hypothetical protein